jgi:hypothetical protein
MLIYQPSDRISATEALKHPYLQVSSDPPPTSKEADGEATVTTGAPPNPEEGGGKEDNTSAAKEEAVDGAAASTSRRRYGLHFLLSRSLYPIPLCLISLSLPFSSSSLCSQISVRSSSVLHHITPRCQLPLQIFCHCHCSPPFLFTALGRIRTATLLLLLLCWPS